MSDVFIKSGEQPRYFAFNSGTSTAVVAASRPTFKESPYGTFQAIVTGTGSVSATILIQVCNQEDTFNGVKANWITMGTITLAGTTTATALTATTIAAHFIGVFIVVLILLPRQLLFIFIFIVRARIVTW